MDPGLARDACFHDRILGVDEQAGPLATPADVLAAGAMIKDPVVKSAAVFGWITEHGRGASVEEGVKLCEVLENPARGTCLRRVSSAHLQR